MQWYNHKVTAAAATYALSGDLVAAVAAAGGAVLPDSLEVPFRVLLPHRTLTHWFPLPLLAAAWFAWSHYAQGDLLALYLAWMAMGAFWHIAADYLSKGGVPLRHPFAKPRGLGFYKVYSPQEHATALAWVVTCGGLALVFGFFSAGHFVVQVDRLVEVAATIAHSIGTWTDSAITWMGRPSVPGGHS